MFLIHHLQINTELPAYPDNNIMGKWLPVSPHLYLVLMLVVVLGFHCVKGQGNLVLLCTIPVGYM